MVWIVSLGLLLLLLQSYQWLHNLHVGLPISLLAGMGLAWLSNSGLTWPKLPQRSEMAISPQVISATLEPPRQLATSEAANPEISKIN